MDLNSFKTYFIILISGLMFSFSFFKTTPPPSSIHQFKAIDIDGNEIDFTQFKGKKLLIVNTASKCGFTPQYQQLEALYKQYKDKGLEIIGFPSNDFKQQEPGNSSEIKEFCKKNYGVSFTMMEKVHVKGDSICEIYQWLTQKEKNGKQNSRVKWNFQKYLIDENGFLIKDVSPWKSPFTKKIIKWLEGK